MAKTAPKVNLLMEEYTLMNDRDKIALRDAFLKKFEYASADSFYRKISDGPLWNIEKEWLAKRLNKALVQLFPA